MPTRKLLRSHLVAAWHKTMEDRYSSQEIDSERALQAHFCAALLREFSDDGSKRRIFIEPTIRFKDTPGTRKPDILICNQRRVIGIVELKYKPRGRASYTKDLQTLTMMAANHQDISVANGRYLGPKTNTRNYSLAEDALLCWAAVYRGKRVNKPTFLAAEDMPNFLALHAITSGESNPIIHPPRHVKNAA